MWEKQGLICKPNGEWWNVSHCYCPTPIELRDCIRVYFAAWDEDNRGRITYVDLDKSDPRIILYRHDGFVLDKGPTSMFDCDGVGPSYLMTTDTDLLLLYYYGFQRTSDKDATLVFAGVALSIDNGQTFKRVYNTPVLERSDTEPDLRSSVSILRDGDVYKVWYTAPTSGWTYTSSDLFSKDKYPNYSVRYLESKSLIKFGGSGTVCLEANDGEFAIGRPWVIKENGKYKMWYSRRSVGQLYRFGYAESLDGVSWTRLDHKVGMDVSESGWDSEMICFPAIVDVDNKRYMFYNGNRHGKDGFGLAIWED